jgi:MOSC domain-containing protein YiiM
MVEITEARTPCRSVRQVDPRALKALVGHAGQMARVVTSGEVRPGDAVVLVDVGR